MQRPGVKRTRARWNRQDGVVNLSADWNH